MNIAQAQSYAALTVALDKELTLPYVTVSLINGSKKVTIPRVMVDTGAIQTILSSKYAKELGIDTSKGIKGQTISVTESCNSYTVFVDLQVSNLSVLRNVKVTFVDEPCQKELLGWYGILQKVKLEVYGGIKTPKLTYSELAQAAMANAGAYFRSRI